MWLGAEPSGQTTPTLNIHIYPSTFANETRILKIVRSLRGAGVFSHITVLALWKEGLPGHETLQDGIDVVRVAPLIGASMTGRLGLIAKAVGWYLGVLMALRGRPVSCCNCHSLPVLPLSVLVKWWKSCVLIYDPHELETETAGLRGLRQRAARILERSLIRFADAVCVVNRSIADWYGATYQLSGLHVVRNLPHRSLSPPERTGLLRRAIGVDPATTLFLYQGLLAPGRGVHLLIDAFSRLPADRHIVFMGYGELSEHIRNAANQRRNIHYLPAVPPDRLHAYTCDADVGIALIEDVCLSYRLSLPNKLFEYAVCGVPSVVSDFPEMGAFVTRYDCGWPIAPMADALVDLLRDQPLEGIAAKRANSIRAGMAFCWQEEERPLLAMYRSLGFAAQGNSAVQPGC